MYGTVARFRLKPGMEERLATYQREIERELEGEDLRGFMFEHVYRLDAGANEYILVVAFESKEAYTANADRPGQHQSYLRFRELLETDPAWQDGEVIYSVSVPEVRDLLLAARQILGGLVHVDLETS